MTFENESLIQHLVSAFAKDIDRPVPLKVWEDYDWSQSERAEVAEVVEAMFADLIRLADVRGLAAHNLIERALADVEADIHL